ncbi:MAG: SH3 domain-containing protein [Chloroflexi bacterium]|nr:SH3 domain-containing protein [Chloroflexota bacterium]MCC6894609.1 SH3 domain-containing protein [Anaerolineae bacterium]
MRRTIFSFLTGIIMLVFGGVWALAQDCAPAVDAIWTAASDACIKETVGYICNGGAPPQVEPVGPVSHALNPIGALVDVSVVTSLRTSPIAVENSNGGLIWLRPAAPIRYTGLMVGDVNLVNNTFVDYPAWQSVVVQTSEQLPSCGIAPRSAYVVQTPFGQPTNIAINGVSVGLNGTLMVQTSGTQTIFAALSGQTSLYSGGQEQVMRPGQQSAVSYNAPDFATPISSPSFPALLDETMVQNFPVALLDRPITLPQPGYVTTDGAVNLRVAPNTDAGVIIQVPAGQVLSVLGRDETSQWYHVRLDSGETGWMFAQLLIQNVGNIQAVYSATPLPPQRYGTLGRAGKVIAPAGVNLRQAPDIAFALITTVPNDAIVTLLARSPYSPWVKVDFNSIVGWVALVALETNAVIEALPIDYNVPPLPEPTRVPGSFGNAFPDPNLPSN